MKGKQQFAKMNLRIGQWLYNLFMLQLYFLLYSFRGLLIGGIYPAIASVYNILYQWIQFDWYDLDIKKEFSTYYQRNFWEANKLGALITVSGLLLVFDLYISAQFIHSRYLHVFLIILFFVWLSIVLSLFSVYARYQLTGIAYLKQSFFIAFGSINQTVATLLSFSLVVYMFTYIPFLLLFFGIPLLFGPVVWFTVQGMNKIEQQKHNESA